MRFSSRKTMISTGAHPSRPRFAVRHRIVSAVAAAAAVLLVGAGLAVTGAASPAQAHTGGSSATCYQIDNDYTSFNGSGGDKNKLVITYAVHGSTAAPVVKTYMFGTSYTTPEVFPDSTKSYDWSTKITAVDGGTQFNFTNSGTTEGCYVPVNPTISVDVAVCTATDAASIPMTVKLGSLVVGRSYTVTANNAAWQSFTADATEVSFVYPSASTGATVSFRVSDRADYSLTAKASATSLPCPGVGDIALQLTQCTVPGGTAGLTIHSDAFVPGQGYKVTTDSGYVGTPVASAGKTLTVPLTVTGDTARNVIVSVWFGSNASSIRTAGATLQPCPSGTLSIAVNAQACSVDDTTRTASITVTGLVPNRSYQVSVDGQPFGPAFSATSATQTLNDVFDHVAFGTHSVSITDTASPTSTASAPFDAAACPTTPKITTHLDPCTVPGGSGTITATVAGLTPGRDYTVTVTDNGQPVPNQQPQVINDATATTKDLIFSGLAEGGVYTIVVVDQGDERATATTTVQVGDCPPMPEVGGVSITCLAGATPTLIVTMSDLTPGQTSWTIALDKQNADGSYTNVSSRSVPVPISQSDLTFPNVANGSTYRVTLTSAPNGIVASEVTPVDCATVPPTTPPTTPTTPGEVGGVTVLATTGADVALPLTAGVTLFGLGALLTVLSVLRRRKEARG